MSLMIPDLRSRLSSIGEEDEDAAEEDGGEDRELSSGEVLEGFEFEPGKSVTRKSLDSILSSWGARELRNLRME